MNPLSVLLLVASGLLLMAAWFPWHYELTHPALIEQSIPFDEAFYCRNYVDCQDI